MVLTGFCQPVKTSPVLTRVTLVMSLLVDTKSGAGFDTGLDFYLRTSSRGEEDSIMTSQSGADPGMLEAPRTGVRGGYGGGYRGLGKNNNK